MIVALACPQFLWVTLCITLFKSPATRASTGLPDGALQIVTHLPVKALKARFAYKNLFFRRFQTAPLYALLHRHQLEIVHLFCALPCG